MRPRSANEWRAFWREGGQRELRDVLGDAWPPLRDADDGERSWHATRIATLLVSSAPLRALTGELGRIRAHELGLGPDTDTDRRAAEEIQRWFERRASA